MERSHVRGRGGFTLIELFAILMGVSIVGLMLLPALGCSRCGSRQIKDSSQVRGAVQAMAIWANNNRDLYPLPSVVDAENWTINPGESAAAETKDSTGHIFSILIMHGSVAPELMISPSEANTWGIGLKTDYQYDHVPAAADPARALWDPTFAADFTTAGGSHMSYAHMPPVGIRREKQWGATYSTTEAVFGNRGPEIAAVQRSGRGAVTGVTVKNPKTETFLIHGSRSTWEGNIGYNDGHVTFETKMWPVGLMYRRADGTAAEDVLFTDEADDAAGLNAYLGTFIKAGKTAEEFRAIWD